MDVNADYVLKFLAGVQYPASKNELVEWAADHGADAYVRAAVKELPERSYASEMDVRSAAEAVELGEAPYSADSETVTERATDSSAT